MSIAKIELKLWALNKIKLMKSLRFRLRSMSVMQQLYGNTIPITINDASQDIQVSCVIKSIKNKKTEIRKNNFRAELEIKLS